MPRSSTNLLAIMVLLLGCAVNTRPEPVYRYIIVLRGDRILLGEPLDRPDIAQQINDTTFALRPGTFAGGGTVGIVAFTDAQGILRSLLFTYDGSEPLATKVRDYSQSLGQPTERQELPDGTRLYVWQDSKTRFELHFAPGHSPEFWSRLVDRLRS